MTALASTSQELLPPPSQADRIVADLHAQAVFATLRDDDVQRRATTLAAILDELAGAATIVWIGNPLRSPLSVERFFLQAAGPAVDVRLERDPAVLARMLVEADTAQRLLVVQQPESMDPELRDLLAGMAPHLTGVQILFCGTSNFRPLPLHRERLPVTALSIVNGKARRRREWLLLVVLVLLVGLGATAVFHAPPAVPSVPAQASTGGAVSGHAPPAVPSAQASTATATTPDPAPSLPAGAAAPQIDVRLPTSSPQQQTPIASNLQTLRQQFDQFLDTQAPRLASLTAAQRDELFQEFLRSRGIAAP